MAQWFIRQKETLRQSSDKLISEDCGNLIGWLVGWLGFMAYQPL